MRNNYLKQELLLTTKDGIVIPRIQASVQDKIYINDITIPIEEGDMFEYILPSKLIRKLLVTKVVLFNVGSHLDHYEIDYIAK